MMTAPALSSPPPFDKLRRGGDNRALHIVHVTPFYAPFVGGAQTYLQAISRRLVRDGHHVTVVTSDATVVSDVWSPAGARAQPPQETLDGVRVLRCPIHHAPGYPLVFYLARRAMTETAAILPRAGLRWLGRRVPHVPDMPRLLRGNGDPIDALHAVNITIEAPSLHAAQEARRRKTPLVNTPFVHVGARDVMRNYTMPHQIDALRASSVVYVQTPREAKVLEAHGVPRGALVQLGMGVEHDASAGADAARFRAKHNLPDGTSVILFLGTLTRDKGAVDTLTAMRRLWQAGAHARLALAGDAPDAGGFARALADLSADERAHVLDLGLIGGTDKQDALAAATALAMPSRVDSFGIVFLEAWLHGKPVVGADAGGVPDVIDDGHDGFLVPFGDPAQLAARLQQLVEQPDLARAMGERGRAKTLAHYTWDAVYARWLMGLHRAVVPAVRA